LRDIGQVNMYDLIIRYHWLIGRLDNLQYIRSIASSGRS